jgi:hypothetical protein
MDSDLKNSKEFYLLSIDIFKMLKLHPEHRNISGKDFLDQKFSIYCKLVENSIIVHEEIKDKLVPLDIKEERINISPVSRINYMLEGIKTISPIRFNSKSSQNNVKLSPVSSNISDGKTDYNFIVKNNIDIKKPEINNASENKEIEININTESE